MQPVTTTFERTISGNGQPVEDAMTSGTLSRQGFTLVELLISLIIAAIVGAALVRMVGEPGSLHGSAGGLAQARSVSRGGINRLFSDLRSVEAARRNGGGRGGRTGLHRPGALCLRGHLRHCGQRVHREPAAGGCQDVCAGRIYRFRHQNATGTYSYYPSNVLNLAGTAALCRNGTRDSIHTVQALNGSPRAGW